MKRGESNLNLTSGLAIGIAVISLGLATWAVTETVEDKSNDTTLLGGAITFDPDDNSVTLNAPEK